VNREADDSDEQLRVSFDAKSPVKIGEFSRGGKNRVATVAADHDFRPDELCTPFGVFLPKNGDLHFHFTCSSVTADFEVDTLSLWWESARQRFPAVKTLVINLDNGPEHHSRRTQFIKRIVEFADYYRIHVRLAYYPPYHSKYNPVERCWGVLENHWNGSLLDSVEATLGFARSMTWKGTHPEVVLREGIYETGKRLKPSEMAKLERRLNRHPELPKWFVDIPPLHVADQRNN